MQGLSGEYNDLCTDISRDRLVLGWDMPLLQCSVKRNQRESAISSFERMYRRGYRTFAGCYTVGIVIVYISCIHHFKRASRVHSQVFEQ
jgi:hypothetical protein